MRYDDAFSQHSRTALIFPHLFPVRWMQRPAHHRGRCGGDTGAADEQVAIAGSAGENQSRILSGQLAVARADMAREWTKVSPPGSVEEKKSAKGCGQVAEPSWHSRSS